MGIADVNAKAKSKAYYGVEDFSRIKKATAELLTAKQTHD